MQGVVGAGGQIPPATRLAAAELFPWGNIGTNGTIKLDKDIPYRIGVSVWAGDDEIDIKLRGANVFRKALKNYAGDKRAIMLFTVSKQTIKHIPEVARLCKEHDLELTYNMYSPTQSFLEKLTFSPQHDGRFLCFMRQNRSRVE